MTIADLYKLYIPVKKPSGEILIKAECHNDKKESLSINLDTGLWCCFACTDDKTGKNLAGDLVDFLQKQFADYADMSFKQVIASIAEDAGITADEVMDIIREAKEKATDKPHGGESIPDGKVDMWHKMLMENTEALNKFKKRRGLNDDTIKRFRIGYDDESKRYTIPILDENGNVVNVRKYNPDVNGKDKMISYAKGYGEARLFPLEMLENDTVMICEGELDALTAIQEGYNAISSTGGASKWDIGWNEYFKDKAVIICYDIDEAGKKGAVKVANHLADIAESVKIINLPLDIKVFPHGDITDYFVEAKGTKAELDRLINNASVLERAGWFEYTSKGGVARFLPEILNRHLIMEHNLLRVGNKVTAYKEGFYRINDEAIAITLIKEHIGIREITQGRINECLNLLVKDERIGVLLDEMNYCTTYINFNNCVVDAVTLKTYEHNPKFRFTYKLDASYNPDAVGSVFDEYLSFAIGEPEGIEAMKRWIGYSLSVDIKAKKALILVGGTDAGKSTLTSALAQIIGKHNVSNLKVEDIDRRFSCAELAGKIMNICPDTTCQRIGKTNFKSLTGGDSVEAEFKGRDPFRFTNKAKLIIQTNDMLGSEDFDLSARNRILPIYLRYTKNSLLKEIISVLNACLHTTGLSKTVMFFQLVKEHEN